MVKMRTSKKTIVKQYEEMKKEQKYEYIKFIGIFLIGSVFGGLVISVIGLYTIEPQNEITTHHTTSGSISVISDENTVTASISTGKIDAFFLNDGVKYTLNRVYQNNPDGIAPLSNRVSYLQNFSFPINYAITKLHMLFYTDNKIGNIKAEIFNGSQLVKTKTISLSSLNYTGIKSDILPSTLYTIANVTYTINLTCDLTPDNYLIYQNCKHAITNDLNLTTHITTKSCVSLSTTNTFGCIMKTSEQIFAINDLYMWFSNTGTAPVSPATNLIYPIGWSTKLSLFANVIDPFPRDADHVTITVEFDNFTITGNYIKSEFELGGVNYELDNGTFTLEKVFDVEYNEEIGGYFNLIKNPVLSEGDLFQTCTVDNINIQFKFESP